MVAIQTNLERRRSPYHLHELLFDAGLSGTINLFREGQCDPVFPETKVADFSSLYALQYSETDSDQDEFTFVVCSPDKSKNAELFGFDAFQSSMALIQLADEVFGPPVEVPIEQQRKLRENVVGWLESMSLKK